MRLDAAEHLVGEIAAELGVHKSTVSRLISVLEGRGFVEQISERGKYRLGFAITRASTSVVVFTPGSSSSRLR